MYNFLIRCPCLPVIWTVFFIKCEHSSRSFHWLDSASVYCSVHYIYTRQDFSWTKVLLTYFMVQNIIWTADYHSAYLKISRFLYGTGRFITVFTKAGLCSVSWDRWIQSTPSQLTSLKIRTNTMTHLRLGLPSGLFHSGPPTNIVYSFTSPVRVTCLAHLILDLMTLIVFSEAYKLWSRRHYIPVSC